MSAPTITSYETIRAGFPPIPFIVTEDNPPNLKFLLLCPEHLGECAQSHPHIIHTFGHRYLALTTIMWALEYVDAYSARVADPGASVTHANGTNTLQRANAESAFCVQYRDYGDEQTMDHALINRQYEMLGPFAIDLKDEARALGTPSFIQI